MVKKFLRPIRSTPAHATTVLPLSQIRAIAQKAILGAGQGHFGDPRDLFFGHGYKVVSERGIVAPEFEDDFVLYPRIADERAIGEMLLNAFSAVMLRGTAGKDSDSDQAELVRELAFPPDWLQGRTLDAAVGEQPFLSLETIRRLFMSTRQSGAMVRPNLAG